MNKAGRYKIVYKALLGAFLLSIPLTSYAGMDESPLGKVYPIQERSLLEVIMERLTSMKKSGEMDRIQEQWKKKSIDTLNNPKGVDLPTASVFETHYYDPSIETQKNIFLPSGELLYPKGTKVNPLAIRGLTKRYIFIDGSDVNQVEFAKALYKQSGWRDKVVLVKGSYMELMKHWKHQVYFDQLGFSKNGGNPKETLVSTFQIKSVPSVLFQNKLLLQIDAVPENNYAKYLKSKGIK